MNKGLDLIERQQPEFIDGFPTGNVYIGLTFEELDELEKELKTLKIIQDNLNNINESEYYKTINIFVKKPSDEEDCKLLREMLAWEEKKQY